LSVKIFIEYKLIEGAKETFMGLVPHIQHAYTEAGLPTPQFWEGTDQPGVIVEEILVPTKEAAEQWKVVRLGQGEGFPWEKLHLLTIGGREKVNYWTFDTLS
jgi:hypothetical protein